jgi:hypothetical protein
VLISDVSNCINRSITGNVDGIERVGGDYFVRGWACARNTATSLNVHLYSGGPAGVGVGVTGSPMANLTSEPTLGTACGTSGIPHRFRVHLNPFLGAHQNRQIWIHGISPHGFSNSVIGGSGSFVFPPAQPGAPTIIAPANGTQLHESTTSVTFSWTPGSGAAFYLVRMAQNAGNGWETIMINDQYRGTSLTVPVVAGRQYSFWVHSATAQFSYDNPSSYSAHVATAINVRAIPSVRGRAMSALTSFDGDRFADYADHHAPSGQFWVHRATGAGSFLSANYAYGVTAPSPDWKVFVADFTGDGFGDFADYHVPSGNVWIHENLRNGSFSPANWASGLGLGAPPNFEILAGDFNGDGYADFAERDLYTGQIRVRVNTGPGTTFPHWSTSSFRSMVGPDWTVVAADFNGDRRVDIADYHIPSGQFWVHDNVGSGDFSPVVSAYKAVMVGSGWKPIFGDFTGDGKADYADLQTTSGYFWMHRNLGGSFDPGDWGWAQHYRPDASWRILGE